MYVCIYIKEGRQHADGWRIDDACGTDGACGTEDACGADVRTNKVLPGVRKQEGLLCVCN